MYLPPRGKPDFPPAPAPAEGQNFVVDKDLRSWLDEVEACDRVQHVAGAGLGEEVGGFQDESEIVADLFHQDGVGLQHAGHRNGHVSQGHQVRGQATDGGGLEAVST